MFNTNLMIFSIVCFVATIDTKYVCPKQCVCDIKNRLKRATCTHQNIVDIDVGVPENVEIYDMNSNNIHQLDDYGFKNMGYKSLIDINLSNNKIFWIGLHALAGLDKLEYLNLSYNILQGLPSDLFWYNAQLKNLDLSGNKFLSFKNKAFLSHSKLKVLNLSNSQISFLPELVFSELPNITNLDLSKNFMIELHVSVLKPLRHLKYLSLDENHWHCNGMFNDLQVWILTSKIEYVTQCMPRDKQKKFEKIISLVPTELENFEKASDEEIDEDWNFKNKEEIINNDTVKNITIASLTFIDNFNAKFPSLWSLIIGFGVGILLGMISTYCWMAELCKCKNVRWKNRRQIQRERNTSNAEDHLLWSTEMRIQPNTETPPILRRQISSPNAFCRSDSWEGASFRSFAPSVQARYRDTHIGNPVRSTRLQAGYETPPPPYRECLHDRVVDNILG